MTPIMGFAARSVSGPTLIPQSLLHHLASTQCGSGMASAVARSGQQSSFAQAYKASLDWLINGEGDPPVIDPEMMHYPVETARRWEELIGELSLPSEVSHALVVAGNRFGVAISPLPFPILWKMENWSSPSASPVKGFEAWITWL